MDHPSLNRRFKCPVKLLTLAYMHIAVTHPLVCTLTLELHPTARSISGAAK